MLKREFLQQLHAELQSITKKCLVLLGGSYVYGESTRESDVDFFIIVPVWKLFSFRAEIRAWKSKYPQVALNIMIVSRPAFKYGWYYVYGRTLEGELFAAPINKRVIIMSALKFAYYHYLKHELAKSEEERTEALKKIAQKIAIIETVREYKEQATPPLATSYIKRRLVGKGGFEWALEVLEAKANGGALPKVPSDLLLKSLTREYQLCKEYATFSMRDYCVYNVKFLAKGRALFLLGNPDTIILAKIRHSLELKEDLAKLHHELTSIIFPVIML